MFYTLPGLYTIKKSLQDIHRQPIFIADADHDYVLDEIEHHDHIYYESQIHNYDI